VRLIENERTELSLRAGLDKVWLNRINDGDENYPALGWGVTFSSEYAHGLVGTPLHVRLHPTQLYDSFAAAGILLVLLLMRRRKRFPGQVWALFMMLYGLMRFTTEFFRGDTGRTENLVGPLSLMQVVSVALMISGVWLWRRGRAKLSS